MDQQSLLISPGKTWGIPEGLEADLILYSGGFIPKIVL